MGRNGLPVYGEDLGSMIEDAKNVIEKIETNKYSKKDLIKLANASSDILMYVLKNEN